MTRLSQLTIPTLMLTLALVLGISLVRSIPARAASVIGSGTSTSCTEADLQAAVAGGGLVTFDCGQSTAAPVTIPITQRMDLSADVVMHVNERCRTERARGDPGVDERNGVGFFTVPAGVSVELRNLVLTNGGDTALINHGTLTLR